MADGKFYWLKLKKDFFKRHDITIIESMPNGKDYILFYLKLLCESVDHEGNLRFSENIPYNEDMLATITRTNVDIVRSAIKIFTELGMMDIMDDGTYFMSEVQKMIGYETEWAQKKREYRAKQKALTGPEEDIVLPLSDKSKSKSKSKSKNINTLSEIEQSDDWFEQWWKLYPKKVGKGKCREKFKKIVKSEKKFHELLDALVEQNKVYSTKELQYVPNPETWLNQGRWEDTLQPTNSKPMTKDDEEFLSAFENY